MFCCFLDDFTKPIFQRHVFLLMVINTLKFKLQAYIIQTTILLVKMMNDSIIQYLNFSQELKESYTLQSDLLGHTSITPANRARLYCWLSDQCFKQKLSRYTFCNACIYIDIFFMKKNSIKIREYQLLALSALILSAKNFQIENKFPGIDLKLFKSEDLLQKQSEIAFSLDFYLNPPNYIDLLNNLAQLWDTYCGKQGIYPNIRYFDKQRESTRRILILYQKMDCLYLFNKILDFNLNQVVLTLFYFVTKMEIEKPTNSEPKFLQNLLSWKAQVDQIQQNFVKMLVDSSVNGRVKNQIGKYVIHVIPTKEKSFVQLGRTYTEFLSFQTFNQSAFNIFRQAQGPGGIL